MENIHIKTPKLTNPTEKPPNHIAKSQTNT